MLADAPVFATIPARDLERAKRFYRDSLGLKVLRDDAEGTSFQCGGGTQLYVYPTRSEGVAPHTLVSWEVRDLESEMADLRGRGVRFEEYDLPGLQTVNGIAELEGVRGAWFTDSEGNILAVAEHRSR